MRTKAKPTKPMSNNKSYKVSDNDYDDIDYDDYTEKRKKKKEKELGLLPILLDSICAQN